MTDSHYNLPHRHSVLDETLSGDEADFKYQERFLGNSSAAGNEGNEAQQMGWDTQSMGSIHSMDDASNGIEPVKSAQD